MKPLLLFILLVVNLTISFAQNNIGIGTNTPHASALLDVSIATKGLLTPRMTTAQRNAIATPAKGLLVCDTDLNSLFHHNGSAWANFSGGGGAFTLPFDHFGISYYSNGNYCSQSIKSNYTIVAIR